MRTIGDRVAIQISAVIYLLVAGGALIESWFFYIEREGEVKSSEQYEYLRNSEYLMDYLVVRGTGQFGSCCIEAELMSRIEPGDRIEISQGRLTGIVYSVVPEDGEGGGSFYRWIGYLIVGLTTLLSISSIRESVLSVPIVVLQCWWVVELSAAFWCGLAAH